MLVLHRTQDTKFEDYELFGVTNLVEHPAQISPPGKTVESLSVRSLWDFESMCVWCIAGWISKLGQKSNLNMTTSNEVIKKKKKIEILWWNMF